MGRWSKAALAGLVCVSVAVPAGVVIAGGNSSSGSVARQTGSWVPSSVEAPKKWKPIPGFGGVASTPGFITVDLSAQMKRGKAKFRIVPEAGGRAMDPGPVTFTAKAANSFTWATNDTCGQGDQHEIQWKRSGKTHAVAAKLSAHSVYDELCV